MKEYVSRHNTTYISCLIKQLIKKAVNETTGDKGGVIVCRIQSVKMISYGNWSTLPTSLWTMNNLINNDTDSSDGTSSDTDMDGIELLSDST